MYITRPNLCKEVFILYVLMLDISYIIFLFCPENYGVLCIHVIDYLYNCLFVFKLLHYIGYIAYCIINTLSVDSFYYKNMICKFKDTCIIVVSSLFSQQLQNVSLHSRTLMGVFSIIFRYKLFVSINCAYISSVAFYFHAIPSISQILKLFIPLICAKFVC